MSAISQQDRPASGQGPVSGEALSPDEARALAAIGVDRRILALLDRGFLHRLVQRGLLADVDGALLATPVQRPKPPRLAPRSPAPTAVRIERSGDGARRQPALRAHRY